MHARLHLLDLKKINILEKLELELCKNYSIATANSNHYNDVIYY